MIESKELKELIGVKCIVQNIEQSTKLQELAFRLGFVNPKGLKEVQHERTNTDRPFWVMFWDIDETKEFKQPIVDVQDYENTNPSWRFMPYNGIITLYS